jgi:peptidoglycan/LPS O-acetylase OafA/YrhL
VGCALGVALASGLLAKYQESPAFKLLIRKLLAPLSLVALVLVVRYAYWRNPNLYYWILFLVEISGIVLVLEVLVPGKSLIKGILESRILTWIGTISYGLYLWHYPVIRFVGFYKRGWQVNIYIAIPLTFLAAAFSFYIIEKPALRLKARFR